MRLCLWTAATKEPIVHPPWVLNHDGMVLTGENRITQRISYLSHCHFVHHKPHVDWPGCEAGSPRWEAGDYAPEPWQDLDLRILSWIFDELERVCVDWIQLIEDRARLPNVWHPCPKWHKAFTPVPIFSWQTLLYYVTAYKLYMSPEPPNDAASEKFLVVHLYNSSTSLVSFILVGWAHKATLVPLPFNICCASTSDF
jgi:hypothetical protein